MELRSIVSLGWPTKWIKAEAEDCAFILRLELQLHSSRPRIGKHFYVIDCIPLFEKRLRR